MLDPASQAWLKAVEDGNLEEADRLRQVLDTADQMDEMLRNSSTYLLKAALTYAEQGIHVFPLKVRGKTPLTKNGFKDATLNLDLITAWWAQWPQANIGLPTGILFDVIDIDGTEGIAHMFNGPDPLFDTLPPRIGHARTSRDGGHHIYIAATGRGNKAGAWPSIDYRGLGGYVVAPPSIGENGVRYLWTRPLEVAR